MRANRIMTSSVVQVPMQARLARVPRPNTSGCSAAEMHATVHTAQAVLSTMSPRQQVVPYTTAYPNSVKCSYICSCEHTGLLGRDTVCAPVYLAAVAFVH